MTAIISLLLGLAIIVLIFTKFGELADATGSSRWKFIPAGIGSYWLGSIVGGVIFGVLGSGIGLYGSMIGALLIRLLSIGAGLGVAFLCYRYFEDNYERLETEFDEPDIRSNREEIERDTPDFKKGNKYKKDIIDDIFDDVKDIRK